MGSWVGHEGADILFGSTIKATIILNFGNISKYSGKYDPHVFMKVYKFTEHNGSAKRVLDEAQEIQEEFKRN